MDGPTFKATITIDDKSITFEGPRDFVEAQVEKFTAHQSKLQAKHGDTFADTATKPASIGEFVQSRQPNGHPETVAVLAFWLTENGVTEFTEEDIKKAYIQAGVRPPKVVGQALRDAKNRFDYVAPGSNRGTYKLSNHGDRTVRFDLPR